MKTAWRVATMAVLAGAALAGAARTRGAGAASSPQGAGEEFYTRVSKAFLDDKAEEAARDLEANGPLIAGLPAAQKADVGYIREAIAEGRPAWWNDCKAGKKTLLKPLVLWGRPLVATYDPEAKSSISMQWTDNLMKITVGWSSKDMDNPGQAEHGYTKGELSDLGIWCTLGSADGYSRLTLDMLQALGKPTPAVKLQVLRYLDFRGNLGGAVYAMPRARRWGLWLYLACYMDKYSHNDVYMGRRAVGAMFVAEVLGHAAAYPSLKVPKDVPADGAEGKAALALKDWIEGHGWTVGEDRSIREALQTLAMANEKTTQASGIVTLGNGLTLALDPEADKPLGAKRDAWVKEQVGKLKGAKVGG